MWTILRVAACTHAQVWALPRLPPNHLVAAPPWRAACSAMLGTACPRPVPAAFRGEIDALRSEIDTQTCIGVSADLKSAPRATAQRSGHRRASPRGGVDFRKSNQRAAFANHPSRGRRWPPQGRLPPPVGQRGACWRGSWRARGASLIPLHFQTSRMPLSFILK